MSLVGYAHFYHIYKQPTAKLARIVIFALFSLFMFIGFSQGGFPKIPIFFLSLFLMLETIYQFKILKTKPKIPVINNSEHNLYESFTLQSIDSFLFSKTTQQVVKELMVEKHVQFIMHKANIAFSEVAFIEISKNELALKAFRLVKELEGKYITRMDLFVAYLLLTEAQTHLLFIQQIKEEELLYILYWARCDFPEEEIPSQSKVVFWGEGIGESFTTGWTLETKKYITDITYKVLDEKPTLLGRKQEFQTMVDVLSRQVKNNILLIGETGVGKTSLVDALALNSFLGLLSGRLYHKRVYQLMVGLLVAGIKDIGDLEQRLQAVLTELTHAENIILYIPDVEQIVGASTFHLDLSGALLPYLRNPHLPIVATVTPGAYKKFVEPMQTFEDLFEEVKLEEPTRDEAIQMLLEKANEVEEKNHITLTFKAVIASVDLAKRYMQAKALPGSAVTLLTSVASSVALSGKLVVDEKDIISKVETQTHGTIATPGQQEKDLLLHLEDKLHARIIGQNEAVNAIAQAIRRLRSGITQQTRPISFLFLGPTGVGKTETAKALASIYFGGEDKTIRLDMSEYTSFDSINRLLGASAGGGNEKGELTEKVYEHPFSLIMLDEFEKAHPEVLDLFLQVLDDGRLTDNQGKTVSFANTIIIATSNAGAFFIQDELHKKSEISTAFQQELLSELEKEHIFKPELLNRFDGIIVFKPLTEENTQQIAKLYLDEIVKRLAQQDIAIVFDESVVKTIAEKGFDSQFGARPLRRFIQDTIEDAIAKQMLEGSVHRGSKLTASASPSGSIVFSEIK